MAESQHHDREVSTEKNWELRDKDGVLCVPDIDATREEIRVVIEAGNTKQPQNAPHHAISDDGDLIESNATMDEELLDGAIEGAL